MAQQVDNILVREVLNGSELEKIQYLRDQIKWATAQSAIFSYHKNIEMLLKSKFNKRQS
jgi:hypothetical protein